MTAPTNLSELSSRTAGPGEKSQGLRWAVALTLLIIAIAMSFAWYRGMLGLNPKPSPDVVAPEEPKK